MQRELSLRKGFRRRGVHDTGVCVREVMLAQVHRRTHEFASVSGSCASDGCEPQTPVPKTDGREHPQLA
jgi:hypothetical protein